MPIEAIYLPYITMGSHLFALKYNNSDPNIFHGYMYAIRTYNHGEFFYLISARKLSAEVMKLFK